MDQKTSYFHIWENYLFIKMKIIDIEYGSYDSEDAQIIVEDINDISEFKALDILNTVLYRLMNSSSNQKRSIDLIKRITGLVDRTEDSALNKIKVIDNNLTFFLNDKCIHVDMNNISEYKLQEIYSFYKKCPEFAFSLVKIPKKVRTKIEEYVVKKEKEKENKKKRVIENKIKKAKKFLESVNKS